MVTEPTGIERPVRNYRLRLLFLGLLGIAGALLYLWPRWTLLVAAGATTLLVIFTILSSRSVDFLRVAAQQLVWDILLFLPDWLKPKANELKPKSSEWWNHTRWECRATRWEQHLEAYFKLKGKRVTALKRLEVEVASARADWDQNRQDRNKEAVFQTAQAAYNELASRSFDYGSRRIDYLSSDRLSILTPKFAAVLTFQGFITLVMTTTLVAFWRTTDPALREELHFLLPAIAAPWAIIVLTCLTAIGNVYWGDLWEKTRDDGGNPLPPREDLEKREKRYARLLIGVLIVRSAALRVVSAVALINFLIAIVAVVRVLAAPPGPQPPPPPCVVCPALSHTPCPACPSHPPPVRLPSTSHLFAPGDACTASTQQWARRAASELAASGVTRGEVSASSDVQPLTRELRLKYGNDVGFAFERAKCVARLLEDELKGLKVHAPVTATVRNITTKTGPSEHDRTAIVEWFR
jgi:hypothetical protein